MAAEKGGNNEEVIGTKNVTLQRFVSTQEGTFGEISFDAQRVFSLELPWRGNKRMVSCIPPGNYLCDLVDSPRFGRVYGVQNVPGRSHILIHAANLGGDSAAGWDTELNGCIAPGLRFGTRARSGKPSQACILQSRLGLERLVSWAGGAPFQLSVLPP